MKQTVNRFRSELLDYSDILHLIYDWKYSVYENYKEELSKDAPETLGKFIILTHYTDTSSYHDDLTEHATTGVLYFINHAPIAW